MLVNGDSSLPIFISHGQRKVAASQQLHSSRRRRHGRLLSRSRYTITGLTGLPPRLRRLLSACLILSLLVIICWRFSQRRQDEIDIVRLSCAVPAFWRFFTLPEFLRPSSSYYTSEQWYTPASSSTAKLGILQVCDRPYKSKPLHFLLDNHRDYAQKHGYEYTLWTGRIPSQISKERGSWLKIEATKHVIEQQLAKPEEERLQWIFHTDTDTLISSASTPLEAFLPPEDIKTPYLVLSRDHNALNAGVFLIRVDERSITLLNQILGFPRKQLRWAEQSALISLTETHHLEESGQLVVVPSSFFNSYEGRAAYPGEEGYKSDQAMFQLHFPSKRFKRLALLPLIRDLQSGAVVQSDALLAKEAALLKEKGEKFWQNWRKNRGV